MIFLHNSSPPVSDLLCEHHLMKLSVNREERIRITVRRRHILEDTLHRLRNDMDYLKITFVGEPAVDEGGPLREYLHRLLLELSQNNSFFCGPSTSRVPRHSVMELEKKSFFSYWGNFGIKPRSWWSYPPVFFFRSCSRLHCPWNPAC